MKASKKRQRPLPGELVKVQSRIGGHPLPAGLTDGDEVTIVKAQNGRWEVRLDGKSFMIEPIHITNIHRFNTCVAPPPAFEPPRKKSR